MKRIISFLFIISVLIPFSRAQQKPISPAEIYKGFQAGKRSSSHIPVKVYSLQNCIEIGLHNNYSLRITKNEEQIAHNNVTWGNAGYLPTLDISGGYTGNLQNTETTDRTGDITKENGVYDQTANVGLNLNWTIFDGFNISTTYDKLKELEKLGELNTRVAVEDFIAELTAEYYNYIQQKLRLRNYLYGVALSRERLRIVEERYNIGSFSRLDLQQARVDFNADSAQYMKQQERLITARIHVNELMAINDVDERFNVSDSIINVNELLNHDELFRSMMLTNASLIRADQNRTLAKLDLKLVTSRNYPYVRLNSGYGYTYNKYEIGATDRRQNLGFNAGVTVGFNIFDGNRKRERRNALIEIENSHLQIRNLEQAVKADFSTIWQAYLNNIEMLKLERQNIVVAKENLEIAMERYLLGDLSGIEMREAQKSLLDAEERLLTVEYDTKVCEISLLQISGRITDYMTK